MIRVLFQGSFEIITNGHVETLRQAKSYGDYLIVGLNTNRLIKEYKHREALLPWEQKREVLLGIRYVDEVVPADNRSPLDLLLYHHIDVYCMSGEWIETKIPEMKYMDEHGGKTIILSRYPSYVHTSEIKRRLKAEEKASGKK